jgi:hypothetical protein
MNVGQALLNISPLNFFIEIKVEALRNQTVNYGDVTALRQFVIKLPLSAHETALKDVKSKLEMITFNTKDMTALYNLQLDQLDELDESVLEYELILNVPLKVSIKYVAEKHIFVQHPNYAKAENALKAIKFDERLNDDVGHARKFTVRVSHPSDGADKSSLPEKALFCFNYNTFVIDYPAATDNLNDILFMLANTAIETLHKSFEYTTSYASTEMNDTRDVFAAVFKIMENAVSELIAAVKEAPSEKHYMIETSLFNLELYG